MKILYCHPLVKKSGRFIESPDHIKAALDLPQWVDMKSYAEKYMRLEDGVVELKNKTFKASVWVSKNEDDDACYLVADSDGNWLGAEGADELPLDGLKLYSHLLWRTLRFSEALAPDERSHLPSEYIRPFFDLVTIEENGIVSLKDENISVDDVSMRRRVVVLGAAGAGKTSYLRRLALDCINSTIQKPKSGSIPIYLQLGHIPVETSLWDRLLHSIATFKLEWFSSSFLRLAESGRLLVLLDGLDEVSDLRRDIVAEEIRSFCGRFPLASVVLTCRNSVFRPISAEFIHFELKPFSRSQIAEWTFRKLHDNPERSWRDFANILFSHRQLLDMVSNPLLLNITTHVYTRQNVLPTNKALLIQTWLDALLDQWDHVRGISRSKEYWASPRRRFTALCRAAFNLCETHSKSFKTAEFISWERSRIDGADAGKTLFSLNAHCGVVESNRDETWRFAHQLLLEHCAASYLVEGPEDVTLYLKDRLTDLLWQNIWLQSCALSQDADRLVLLVLDGKSLDDWDKSELLCKAFTQPLRVERNLVFRCAEYLDATLNKASSYVDFQNAETEKRDCLWYTSFQVTEGTMHDVGGGFVRVLKAFYEARYGALREQLMTHRSPLTTVLNDASTVDGVLYAKCINAKKQLWVVEIKKPGLIPEEVE